MARGGRRLGYRIRVAMYSHLQRLSLAYHDKQRTGDVLTRVTGDVLVVEEFVVQVGQQHPAAACWCSSGSLAFLLWQSWNVALVAVVVVPDAGAGLELLLAADQGGVEDPARPRGRAGLDRPGDADLDPAGAELRPRRRRPGAVLHADREEHARLLGGSEHPGPVQLRRRADGGARHLCGRLARGGGSSTAARSPSARWCCSSCCCRTCSSRPARSSASGTRSARSSRASSGSTTCSTARSWCRTSPTPSSRHRSSGTWSSTTSASPTRPNTRTGRKPRSGRRCCTTSTSRSRPARSLPSSGSSGAGKSTIAQLVPRLYDPDEGAVLVDGLDVRQLTLSSLRSQVSLVLQDTVLLSGTVGGEHRVRHRRRDARAHRGGGPDGERARLHHGPARRLRDAARRARGDAVGWSAAAHRHRPGLHPARRPS